MVGRYTNPHFGQTCCTIHRAYVDRTIADDFVEAQWAFFDGLTIGHQADAGCNSGRSSTRRSAATSWRPNRTPWRGGKPVLAGGEAAVAGRTGVYPRPALYRTEPGIDCNPAEVFHTYATVCPVASPEEALRLANSSPHGLGASVWTHDIDAGWLSSSSSATGPAR
ncbi:aldehyde dehydrogenase family protein [bacterium]|nr:aldehyde dehydrogenase family protein [bacterium]